MSQNYIEVYYFHFTDAKAMDTPNPLSPMQSEKENLPLYLEDDQYINMGISSPTDV